MDILTFKIYNIMTYDRLHTLAAEYNVSSELLINLAIKHLLDDIDLFRKLRSDEKDWLNDYLVSFSSK